MGQKELVPSSSVFSLPFIQEFAVVVYSLEDWGVCQLLVYSASTGRVDFVVLGRYDDLEKSLAAVGAVVRSGDQLFGFFLQDLYLVPGGKSPKLFFSRRHCLDLSLAGVSYIEKGP